MWDRDKEANIWGKLMEDQGGFSGPVCAGHFGANSQTLVIRIFFPSWYMEVFSGKCHVLLLGRNREGSDPFLHLLFLKCLQLKITDIRKWHIWGWHVLNPFTFFLQRMVQQLGDTAASSPSPPCLPSLEGSSASLLVHSFSKYISTEVAVGLL